MGMKAASKYSARINYRRRCRELALQFFWMFALFVEIKMGRTFRVKMTRLFTASYGMCMRLGAILLSVLLSINATISQHRVVKRKFSLAGE